MAENISVKDLLEAGAHFGHQVSRWNPKMRPYIFSTKGDIHILDLEQTMTALQKACDFITKTTALGSHVLFVGTKKQAAPIIEFEANRSGQYFINNRWLGGLLTNFKTIKASIERLADLEKKAASPEFEKYTKKERLSTQRDINKLNSIFSGIKTMQRVPGCVFILDSKTEDIAKKEAIRLKIPVVAVVDTNSNPDGVDYVIPANDDAVRSIQIITKAIADACEEGMKRRQVALAKDASQEKEEKKPAPFAKEKEMAGEPKPRVYVAERKKKGPDEVTESEKK